MQDLVRKFKEKRKLESRNADDNIKMKMKNEASTMWYELI
jgi:hypothetical protein